MDNKYDEFMEGLKELTLRTGVEIGGCGCCGSPFISHKDPNEKSNEYYDIEWNEETLEYDWEVKK